MSGERTKSAFIVTLLQEIERLRASGATSNANTCAINATRGSWNFHEREGTLYLYREKKLVSRTVWTYEDMKVHVSHIEGALQSGTCVMILGVLKLLRLPVPMDTNHITIRQNFNPRIRAGNGVCELKCDGAGHVGYDGDINLPIDVGFDIIHELIDHCQRHWHHINIVLD
jgi:hypothetical protein